MFRKIENSIYLVSLLFEKILKRSLVINYFAFHPDNKLLANVSPQNYSSF